MNFLPWRGRLAIGFLLISLLFNLVLYLSFNDSEYIFKFILAQLGFLPISVYLVTVVINQLLGRREKEGMLKKLNMVIGTFFSEVGTELLQRISANRYQGEIPLEFLQVDTGWKDADYQQALARLDSYDPYSSIAGIDWLGLRDFLVEEREFLLSLLGNPNLLEHEVFTELLWAVFHLAEELSSRRDVLKLPENDYQHLIGDLKRVHVLLVTQWLAYMQHLQTDYPYLFSLAVRKNPFNPKATVEIS